MTTKAKTSPKPAATPTLKLISLIPIGKPATGSIPIHQDCVDQLRQLLRQAERGELVGIAYAAVNNRRSYRVMAAGLAYDNPTFGIGMVEVLKESLMKRAVCR